MLMCQLYCAQNSGILACLSSSSAFPFIWFRTLAYHLSLLMIVSDHGCPEKIHCFEKLLSILLIRRDQLRSSELISPVAITLKTEVTALIKSLIPCAAPLYADIIRGNTSPGCGSFAAPCKVIQTAIASCPVGGVVFVAPGENLSVSSVPELEAHTWAINVPKDVFH